MMQKLQTVTKILLAACTLHNLLADKNPLRMQQAADRVYFGVHPSRGTACPHQLQLTSFPLLLDLGWSRLAG